MSMATLCLSQTKIEKKIISYQKKLFAKNPNITLNSISIVKSKPLVNNKEWGDNWRAYTLEVNLKFRGKNVDISDIVFSDGELISLDLFDINTGESIKQRFTSKITDKYYDDTHFVIGNKKAKHKLIVFSDPLCPACKDFVPKILKFAKKNKKTVALYYYGFPLVSIHPNSSIITKMALVAHNKKHLSTFDVYTKIYKANLPSDISKSKAISRVNKILGLNGKKAISKKDFTKDILKIYKQDIKDGNSFGVAGTPTLYVNGEKDTHRTKYLTIVK